MNSRQPSSTKILFSSGLGVEEISTLIRQFVISRSSGTGIWWTCSQSSRALPIRVVGMDGRGRQPTPMGRDLMNSIQGVRLKVVSTR